MKELFLKRMQEYLKDEYEEYLKTLEIPLYRGIRKNLLKDSKDVLEKTFSLTPSIFCKEGYYMDETISGNHPYHMQGLFYMQEPSATSVVEVADIQKGEWVLDLCAAPGGKSSQIASKLGHTGFLVSNEVVSNRANILLSNMERMGVCENMIISSEVSQVAKEMQGWFDKVIVDAPCSGEGMFKKHEKAMEDWTLEHVEACSARQSKILDDAYKTLKQNGILVYSTCTYAMEENEQVIYHFLKNHPDMELLDCAVPFGRGGLPYEDLEVEKVRRIFPMDKGEGHFIAKMRRTSENSEKKKNYIKEKKIDTVVYAFLETQLEELPPYLYENNQKIYAKFSPFIKLEKIRILRQGVLCGEIVKNRIEPHHHFYMASIFDEYRKNIVEINEEECRVFMSGNVLNKPFNKGYVGISYHGHLLGFGKSDGNVVKNKFPKGLRI